MAGWNTAARNAAINKGPCEAAILSARALTTRPTEGRRLRRYWAKSGHSVRHVREWSGTFTRRTAAGAEIRRSCYTE